MLRRLAAGAAATAVAVAGPSVLPRASEAVPGTPHAGRHDYLVLLAGQPGTARHDARAQARTVAGRAPQHVFRSALSGYTVSLTAAEAARMAAQEGVLSVERDRPVHAASQTVPTGLDRVSSPDLAGQVAQPGLADGVDDARVDADVAIIDSGVAVHPDLDVVGRVDCTLGPTCQSGTGVDTHGHGTHVAGIAAALDDGSGVVGVAPGARIWSVRVLGPTGGGTLSQLVTGIDWTTRHAGTIDVANLSVSCGCVSPALDAALSGAVDAGITVVGAAGNLDADAGNLSLSGNPDVLTVSALADFDGVSGAAGSPTCRPDADDTLADFSSWGTAVDLTAPGVCITSTWPGGGYAVDSGTSMAAPQVAGAAALLTSDPAYRGRPDLVRARLLADGNQGWTDDSGDGVQEPLLDVSGIVPVTTASQPAPALTISDPWVVESPAGATARFTVSTDRPMTPQEYGEVTVATKNGTATSGQDYTARSATTLVLRPGHESQTVDVAVRPDAVPEGVETFTLALSAAIGVRTPDPTGVATVVDPGGPLTLAVRDTTVPETGGSVQVPITLSAPVPTGRTVSVRAATANGSALAGSDYGSVSQTVTFTAGQTTRIVTVPVLDDSDHEGPQALSIKLSSPSGAVLADTVAAISVLDDEDPVTLGVGDARLVEGSSGTSSATFVLGLSAPPPPGVTPAVTVATANGTAVSSSDYTRISAQRVTFPAGVLTRTVAVAVNGDTAPEADETFRLLLSKPAAVTLSDTAAVATIADDDGHPPASSVPTLTVDDTTLEEGGLGSATGTVALRLSTPPDLGQSVSVTVASSDGTAVGDQDFARVPPTVVTFGPGEDTQGVPVQALDDTDPEPAESFDLDLSSPVGAVLADAQGVVTVQSEEMPRQASVGNAWALEGDGGPSTVDVPVSIWPPAGPGGASVLVSTSDATAVAGSDYDAVAPTLVSFAPGESVLTVPVTLVGDTSAEGVERFWLNATGPGLVLADAAGEVTIVDEEGPG